MATKLNWKIWLLIILLVITVFAIINPKSFSGDVMVKEIEANSSAEQAGISAGEIIKAINGAQIKSIGDYSEAISSMNLSENQSVRITILTDRQDYVFMTDDNLGIIPSAIPKTKLKTGLDLQGGARALVAPEKELSASEMQNLIEVVRNRLSVYGLTDVTIKDVSDLGGKHFMLVEMAGATPKELQELVGKQGKFEAKIGDIIVFEGGKNDIPLVCKNDAKCSYIEQCSEVSGGQACSFKFQITLSAAAAQRQAEATMNLAENISGGESWLNESLDLYLDDVLVESLRISSDLKGKASTTIVIEGSGFGATTQEAYDAAQKEMNRLQTILITGSLPYKLNIEKLDSISPALGTQFMRNIFIASIAAFIGVCLIIYIRYRKFNLVLPVIFTMLAEVVLILGVAALIKWNIDLVSIVGIVAAIGTGVDDQVVMIDESESTKSYTMKERIKRALFIIMGAYATVMVSLIPLWWAGAGMLRGFAITTGLGVTIGVFITRPAFGEILKRIKRE